MNRVNQFTVQAEEGVILEHDAVFGMAFGAAGVVKQHLGTRNGDNANQVCIHFRTGNTTEVNVGYDMEMSPMAYVIYKNVLSVAISEDAWAIKGDANNIVEGLKAMTFVSADGKDPRTGFTKIGFVQGPNGYTMGQINVPPRPGPGLKPNTDYYVTITVPEAEGGNNPLNLRYMGTDDSEHGGEVLINVATPVVPTAPTGTGDAIPMSFGPMHGVFIPD